MDDNRWSDRDRSWREERGFGGRDRDRAGRGNFGRGGEGGRGYAAQGAPDADQRWRQMHQDRRHEGAAGYNDSGPIQGGWEFGDEDQGGERGQGYERYGYGRGPSRPIGAQGSGYYDEYGRDPGVGSAYGESWGGEREYGRGGGAGAGVGGGYGVSGEGGGYSGQSTRWSQPRGGYGGRQNYAYGAHTPYGYRGENEYDQRGRGGDFADDGRQGREDRSWLARAGERVSNFFGAEGEGQHRGRGPKGYRRSDDRIREDISDRLTDDPWLDASNIEIQVRECDVTLSGQVASREDKRRAETLAEAISGVRNVSNNLRVEDGRTTAAGGQTTTTGRAASGNGNEKEQKGGGSTRLSAPDATPGLNT